MIRTTGEGDRILDTDNRGKRAGSRRFAHGLASAMLALLIPICAGCARNRRENPLDPRELSGVRALEEVRGFLSLGRRDSGTAGAEKAARYLLRRLDDLGIDTEMDEFADRSPRGTTTFRNVIGRLPGRGKGLIVLGSHYDTKSGMPDAFEGANDSGSSTGLLLELAGVLAGGAVLSPEIWFAFFDGEEAMREYSAHDGLHGSKRLARRLLRENRADDVVMVLVLDMIGDRDLNVWIPDNGTPALRRLAMRAAHRQGVASFFRPGAPRMLDDHVPFLAAGLPAILFIDFEFGPPGEGNAWWHTRHDTLDKLSPESLEIVGRTVLEILNLLEMQR